MKIKIVHYNSHKLRYRIRMSTYQQSSVVMAFLYGFYTCGNRFVTSRNVRQRKFIFIFLNPPLFRRARKFLVISL